MRTTRDPPRPTAGPPSAPERPSFRQLYDEHVDRVWWRLRALGVPAASCADATQEVFVVVHKLLPTYEPRGRTRGWLAAIAANIAGQYHRRQGRLVTSDADPDEQAAGDFDVDRELAGAEEVQRVLEGVHPNLSLVFMLHYFEELSVDEIARQLDVPEGTVKDRLRRARVAVKAAWTRHEARERSSRSVVVPLFPKKTWREAGKHTPRLPDDVREQIWAGVERACFGGGDGGGGAGSGGRSGGATGSAPGALGSVVAVPVGALAGGAGLLGFLLGLLLGALWAPLHRPPVASPPGLDVATAGVASAVLSPTPPAPALETSSAPPTESPHAVPASASTVAAASPSAVPPLSAAAAESDALERALIAKAKAKLTAGDPDAALAALREHAAVSHGGGRRALERERLWIAALVRAGRTGEARERLARFEVLYPKSPDLGELRANLASARSAP